MANEYLHSERRLITGRHLGWLVLIAVSVLMAVASIAVSPIVFVGLAGIAVGVVVLLKYPFVGLLLYLAIFVLRPGEMYPVLAPLALERIVGLGVLIAGMLLYKKKHGTFAIPSDKPFLFMLGYFFVIMLTLSVTLDTAGTLESLEGWAKLIVFFLLIYYTIDSPNKFAIFIALFVLLILREAALSLSDYYGGGAIVRMGIQRATGRGSFGSGANTLAATLVFAMPFLIGFWKLYRNWLVRLMCLGSLFLLAVMVVNTGSRGGLLALLTVVAMTIFYSKHRVAAVVVSIALLAGGWVVLPDQYKGRYATLVSDKDANEISTGRVAIWENGIRMFKRHPFLGIGSGAFIAANSSGDYGPPIDLNPHSLTIQLLAETGAIGFLVWAAFLISYVRLLFKRKSPRRGPPGSEELIKWLNAYKEALLGSTAALVIAGLTAHSLTRFNWYVYSALTVVMLRIFWLQYNRLEAEAAAAEENQVEPVTGEPVSQ